MICGGTGSGSGIEILTWTSSVNLSSLMPGAWTLVWTFAPVSSISIRNGHFDYAIVYCEYLIDYGDCGCEICDGYGYDCDCGSSYFYGYGCGDDEIYYDFYS